jgi:biopolymer transport protein ExbD
MKPRTLPFVAAMLIAAVVCCTEREDASEPTMADALPAGAVGGIALERIGTIGDYPATPVVVNVDAEGTMTVGGQAMDLAALEKLLLLRANESRSDSPGNPSDVAVVLRLDRTLPWGAAQWLMQTCAHPEVRIMRIHFAVLPEDGSEEGSLAAHLDPDAGLIETPARLRDRLKITARVHGTGEGSSPGSMFEKAKAILAADPTLACEVNADRLVPTGYVLRVMDVLHRAGAREMTFVGTRSPQGPGAIANLVGEARKKPVMPTIELLGTKVGDEAGKLPPLARVRGSVVGTVRTLLRRRPLDRLDDGPDLDTLFEDPPEDPYEWTALGDVPVEESPRTGRAEELAEAKVVDAPFDGPPNGATIGLGGSAGRAFGGRSGKRDLESHTGGGTMGAVDLGLEWLKNHQGADGRWDADGFEAQCKLNKCGGHGGAAYDTGVSGLALLAFLWAGETHKTGRYRRTVALGLKHLKEIQDAEGCFGSKADKRHTYTHACAALAMTEAYGVTGSPLFKQSAQRGVDFIMKCQTPYLAWRYGERPRDNDTSVTGWMLLVLRSAKSAGGLKVPAEGFEGAKAWIDKVTEPEFGRAGYTARGAGPYRSESQAVKFPAGRSEALTAVGIVSRLCLGESPNQSEMILKGAYLCTRRLPEWDTASGSIDMVYWFYGTLGLFQVGGDSWKAWNVSMKSAIVDHQRKDGDQRGSWDPVGVWGREGGRVYATALMTVCLEAYYRFARVIGMWNPR